MGFDVEKALREKQEAEKYLTAAEQLERRQEALRRALEPARELNKRLLAATRNLSGLDQFDRLAQRVAEQAAKSMGVVPNAQLQRALASYDSQVAQMSRRILEGMNAQMVGVRLPRLDASRPPLDPVLAEVPYSPHPAPEPVADGDVAPIPQSSAPGIEQDIVVILAVGLVTEVVGGLLVEAILWRIQTGAWVFEELLVYYLQQLK